MSLFSSIQIASNALNAAQIGLQVTGNNIANANTPGYVREELVLKPAPTQRLGGLLLGLGVEIDGIIQKSDGFLEERLRGATSDLKNGKAQEQTHLQLESIIGELSDTDLSTSLSSFFGSINDILNQPESISVRNLAVLQGETLAGDIRRLAARVGEIRDDLNRRVINSATDINRLLQEVADLNVKITTAEGGGTSPSDAVGLRDRRSSALIELASLTGIRTVEQTNSSVTVFSGGDFLVFEGSYRAVKALKTPEDGIIKGEVVLEATNRPIDLSTGELGGLVTSRDEVAGGFLEKLDEFTQALVFEFNKTYSSGQGLKGYEELTSEHTVADTGAALDEAGLGYLPVNGSFQVQVFNEQTSLTQTTDVFVELGGLDGDTSLEDLRSALDAIDGISAEITPARALTVKADSPNVEFAFAGDTSGALAALGLGTFFTGTSAGDMGVSQVVRDDPARFAASRTGIGRDTQNAVDLADFINRPLDSQSDETISVMYDRLTGETTQAAAVSRAVAEGFRVFQQTLEGQQMAISGVNIDEEAVRMITYQRAYQAAARYIATISELLDTLVNL